MTFRKKVYLFTLAIVATGCSASSDNSSVFQHISILNEQQLAVHAHSGPDAIISVAGDLAIGGKNIVLDQNQKNLLARYFASAMELRSDGLAAGAAGTKTAATAISSVAAGLASGNPDKIGPEIDASAAKIDAVVAKICSDMAQLHSTQDTIAAALADFKPYALIDAKQVSDCHAN